MGYQVKLKGQIVLSLCLLAEVVFIDREVARLNGTTTTSFVNPLNMWVLI